MPKLTFDIFSPYKSSQCILSNTPEVLVHLELLNKMGEGISRWRI